MPLKHHILHWGSDYSAKKWRTIHLAYQAFAAPIYRYFHLWWDPTFRDALQDAEQRRVFARWSALIDTNGVTAYATHCALRQ